MATAQQRLPSTQRISAQPVMALGLNGTELIIVLLVGVASMMIFAVIGTLIMPTVHLAMLLGFFAAFVFGFIARTFITFFKRQKPDGYYQQLLRRVFRDAWGNPALVNHEGHWDAMRHYRS